MDNRSTAPRYLPIGVRFRLWFTRLVRRYRKTMLPYVAGESLRTGDFVCIDNEFAYRANPNTARTFHGIALTSAQAYTITTITVRGSFTGNLPNDQPPTNNEAQS